MGTEMRNKHFDFCEKDISEGKYSAWELIQPLWYTDIYLMNVYQ